MFRFLVFVGFFLPLVLGLSTPALADWQSKISQAVLDNPDLEKRGFFVLLKEQADQLPAPGRTKTEKGEIVFQNLTRVAKRTQPALVKELDSLEVQYEQFWIANAIWVEAGQEIVRQIAQRPDVAKILENSLLMLSEFRTEEKEAPRIQSGALTYGWNIDKIEAWRVWAEGFFGQGAVIGTIDTGVTWDLPELIDQYRGWDGNTADHNYNWHDAVDSGGTDCPAGSLEPCDEFNHGTGTLGLAVSGQLAGDGLDTQIGVAPQAKWITCRVAVDPASGASLASVVECLQWMLAPTDLNGQFPDPGKAPDVLNTSWGCAPGSGCEDPLNMLEPIFQNLRAAGIFHATAAGNSGPDCDTVSTHPDVYQSSMATGSSGVDSEFNDIISGFSSRGPAAETGLIKPDVVAPGQGVGTFNRLGTPITVGGTSASSPHLAGVVALLISASPELAGDVDKLELLVKQYADPRTSGQTCGGTQGDEIPNNTWGWGRINAWNSYLGTLVSAAPPLLHSPTAAVLSSPRPNPFNPSTMIAYSVPRKEHVKLSIYDISGRLVQTLVDESQEAGPHTITWNGRDGSGKQVTSGVYLYQLLAGDFVQTKRMVLLK